MDMKKISCFVLVAAFLVSTALVEAHGEAAHPEEKKTPTASAPAAASAKADAPEAAAAGHAAAAGPGAAGAPGPAASGADAAAPVFGLIGASLVSLVAFYLQ